MDRLALWIDKSPESKKALKELKRSGCEFDLYDAKHKNVIAEEQPPLLTTSAGTLGGLDAIKSYISSLRACSDNTPISQK